MSSSNNPVLPFAADFNFEELVTKHEAIVEIDPVETMVMEEEEYSREQLFNDLQLGSNRNDELFAAGCDTMGKPLRGLPGAEPFSNYFNKMRNVTRDEKVKKQILREGNGEMCPENANVVVKYNAYIEFGQLPYDTTFKHGKPLKCSIDHFVEGLGIGIGTMKKKEQAQFLIHPDMAYRALGVPPRIPKNATILYEVELVDFTEIKIKDETAAADDNVSEKVPKTKFQRTMEESKKAYEQGNESFHKKDYRGAIKDYNKSLGPLERCSLANEEEQKEQEKLLLRLYVNLALCHNKVQEPRATCNMCKAALRLDFKNIKALISWGRALVMLSDFQDAREKLKRALRFEPGSTDILDELIKLDDKEKRYIEDRKLFAQKAFSS